MCGGEMAQPQQKAAAFSWLRESSCFHYTYRGAGAMTGFSFSTSAALTEHFPTLAPSEVCDEICTHVFEQVTSSLSGLALAPVLLRFQPIPCNVRECGMSLRPSLKTTILLFLDYSCRGDRAASCRRKTLSPLGQHQRSVSQNCCESEYFHSYFHFSW